jgi:aminoglycoside phosphotransferase (APT) family kinase protein
MKSAWPRNHPEIALDSGAVETLVAPLFPGERVVSFVPVAGGLINTNLKVTTTRHAILLRIYQGDPAHAAKEVAITARIAGTVPVANSLYFSPANPVTGHPCAILEWIDGQPLEAIGALLDRTATSRLGRSVGHALAAIHSFTFDKLGFFAADLSVPHAIDLGRTGLLNYLTRCLVDGPGGARLGAELTASVLACAQREGEMLESWLDPPSLVHGDFNAPNILVRPNTAGDPEVAAVLDWEFALSGSPALDFGNLLRPPPGRDADFVAMVADGYRKAGGSLPSDWQHVAQIADLFAWADILSRPSIGPEVLADARQVVADIIAGDEPC